MDNKTATTNTTQTTAPNKEPSKTLIYVSNLPFETTDEQFRDLFKGFTVKTAYIARRKNGRSKGFGFANLEKETEQNAAIEKLNGFDFEKRKLIAKVAMNDDRRNEKGELKEEFRTATTNTGTPSDTVVYVSNLEWSVTDEELRKIFAEFNPKVVNVAKRRNGRSKGFGFVEFNNSEDQQKALKLDNQSIGGRQIIVKPSTGYRGDKPEGSNNGGKKITSVKRRTDFTLYVKNLPLELDENDLRDVFQEFNPKSARIVSRNGNSRGYGFVEFATIKEQNDAQVALDQSEINGRVVTVSVSNSRKDGRRNNRDNNRRNNNNNRGNNNNNRGNNNRDNNNRDNNRGGNNNNNNRNNNNRGNNNRDNNRNNNNNNRGNNNNNNNNNDNRRQQQNRQPRENREVSTNLVYVSNLPFNLEDNGLGEIFKGLKINKAYVARRRNGYSKGFGFVEFATTEDQQKAIKQNGSEVSGRPIVVQAAFKVDEKTN